MWQPSDEVTPNSDSKNNLCTKSLLHNLVKSRRTGSANSSSLDQQSNSSSLESIKSFALDGNQALSTSCSEDSFEMSGTNSRPAAEDPSQQSLQSLSFLGPENSVRLPNIDYQNRKSSEYNSSDQISRDNLDPCSSLGKSSSLKNMNFLVENALTLTSNHLDHFNEPGGAQEISWDEVTENRGRAKITESCPIRNGIPGTWKSRNSIKRDKISLRESIDKELDNLDTCLPRLDFNKLEEKLNCAAKERMVTERKLLGEQVRRRLALQVDHYTAEPSPRIYTRPLKSNLKFRLQTAMNLQVCYINDLKDDGEDEEESLDDDFSMPKSKSEPNLRSSVIDGSNLNASQLRQVVSAIKEKRQVLEEETKMMLAKAKQAARMQMEIEKINTNRFTVTIPPKASRLQLSKMTRRQLVEMSEKISKRINEENAELMRLLVEKDSLYMQQDSMLVDIEDMIQHESSLESLHLPDFLKVQATLPAAFSKFRIFNS